MKIKKKLLITAICSCLAINSAHADEREDLLALKNTITNLIDQLVEAGVIDREQAELMQQTATAKAKLQAAQQLAEEDGAKQQQVLADEKSVRVQYVPEHVKQEIRAEVRTELREEVVADVMTQAKTERWGVPAALPGWISRFKMDGDIRIRGQLDHYSDDILLDLDDDGLRDLSPDFLALNDSQSNLLIVPLLSRDPNEFFQERVRTRSRTRERLRLGIDAEVNPQLKLSTRISTGNIANPVSTNQTLGNSGQRFDIQLDRAFLQYNGHYVKAMAGRIPNPFVSTSLVFDEDLSFEGAALNLNSRFTENGNLAESINKSKNLFMTVGASSLSEIEISPHDKWLLGAQVGLQLVFGNQSSLLFAGSYLNYRNIYGLRNDAEDAQGFRIDFQKYDYTAPEFLQGGNTMFDIRNDFDTLNFIDPINTALYALASDYNLVNFNLSYDLAAFDPIHAVIDIDAVRNVGYDRNDIIERISHDSEFNDIAQVYQDRLLTDPLTELEEKTDGYHINLTIGWPALDRKGNWQISGGYKYLERDAVLDAFTESEFHLGGTNAKGYIIGGSYALMDNAWLEGRWFSADQIDGPVLGFDVIQFDLNARF